MKLFSEQPLQTSQFDMSNIQKQVRSVIRNHLDQCANFGPLPINVMRDSKPQRFVLQHKSLKVTQIATNRGKHINEAWKKVFAHNLFLISCL